MNDGINMHGHGISELGDLIGSGKINFSAPAIWIRATNGAGNIVFLDSAGNPYTTIKNIVDRLDALESKI